MSNREKAKEIREEQGQWAALKFALTSGKEELSDDFEQLGEDVDDLKAQLKGGEIEKVTCRACEREVNSFEVSRCEHCGYDASGHQTWRWIHTGIAVALCFTLIGIPLAILPIMKARGHTKRAKQGVVKVHRS